MKPHRTVIGAAALSLAVAGSLAGAGSAKADDGQYPCTTFCGGDFSNRTVALGNVLFKFDSPLHKADSPFFKLDTALSKIEAVLLKFSTD